MTIDSRNRFAEVSDVDLILGVRNGNRESEAQLFTRHKQLALAVAYRHTDTPSEAEDVVSEAFLRVFDSLRRGVGPDEFFRAYLLTVVSREAFSRNDAASKRVVTDDVKEFEVGDPQADEALKRAEASFVISAFKSLPERWRAVLWHIEIEDLRPREIAPLLGLTPNAASALAVRAREGLREAYLATHLNKHIDLAPTCSDARKLLPSLIRVNASNRDQRMVKAHLAICKDCSAVFSELSQVGLKLRAYVLPLVVGGATALGFSAVGGVATGTAAVAGGTTVFGMATGATAAAPTAAAAGLIPPIVAEDKQEKVATLEAPAVPAPSATAFTTSPKIEAHQMFGDRATFDKYIVADTPKAEVPVAPKSPVSSAKPAAPKPSATPTPVPVSSPSPTPSIKPTPSPKPVLVPTV